MVAEEIKRATIFKLLTAVAGTYSIYFICKPSFIVIIVIVIYSLRIALWGLCSLEKISCLYSATGGLP